jgi:hypothetical protein
MIPNKNEKLKIEAESYFYYIEKENLSLLKLIFEARITIKGEEMKEMCSEEATNTEGAKIWRIKNEIWGEKLSTQWKREDSIIGRNHCDHRKNP